MCTAISCAAGRLATTLLRGRLPEHVLLSTASVWRTSSRQRHVDRNRHQDWPCTACTLPQYTERLSPLPDNRRGGNAPPDAPLRFFVDLERDRIAWLVRLRLIKPNEAHDLVVILTALKRIGLAPSISCGP